MASMLRLRICGGSADTMATLPEYTAEETGGSKMGSETLPGYADSEESVSVADGY